jgi:hypothetical protein
MSDSPPAPDDDPLVFTPVPVTARRDGWTAERQRAFIASLASHGSVGAAARAVGMTPQTARRLRTKPQAEGFARAWDVAAEEGRLRAIDAAIAKGMGEVVPVYRRGRLVGARYRTNDRLLFAACYGHSPLRPAPTPPTSPG